MSGTSMDGIDAALLETNGSPGQVKEIGHITLPYDSKYCLLLKAAEYTIRNCLGNLEQAQRHFPQALTDYLSKELKISDIKNKYTELLAYLALNTTSSNQDMLDAILEHSTTLHISAVEKLLQVTRYLPTAIDVIGYHGQAMFHRPAMKVSVIIGNGQRLANTLGITVVNDFRSNDMHAGGQGAPFAPLYHQALAVRDNRIPLAVVNCGGIANITFINNANECDLIGFDTGPGNGLVDRLVRQRTQGKEQMDRNGQYGKTGRVSLSVLKTLYEQSIIKDSKNYFTTKPPKSLDINDMKLIPALETLSLADAAVTLEIFTAETIVASLAHYQKAPPHNWILAGGGWHNPIIRQAFNDCLRKKLGFVPHIQTADEAGWNAQAMEAQIFAYLAVRSLQNKPLSVPSTTGVPHALSGGRIYTSAT